MEKISKAISYIFHPLIIPTLGLLIIKMIGAYLSSAPFISVISIVFLSTFIVPLVFMPFLIYWRLISNIDFDDRKDRQYPLIVCLIFFIFCYYLLGKVSNFDIYRSFIFASILSVLVTLLITLRYKISIHMVGAGGLVAWIGFLAFHLKVDLQFYLVISLILAGITGTARLILKAHTPDQIYTGFLTGFSVVLLTLVLSQ